MTTLDFHRHRSNGHRTETRSPQTGGADAHASVGQLVQQASRQLTDLVRAEMRLAQTEMTQKGKRFGAGGGMLAAAGVVRVPGAGDAGDGSRRGDRRGTAALGVGADHRGRPAADHRGDGDGGQVDDP
ncbi:hypothetical protein M2169_005706 [Streptomyces sp. MJP52]|nr:hypothetical protein [Streptomyces sp. MJP52]